MRRLLPLVATLSAIALGASIVRVIALLPITTAAGSSFSTRTLVLLETGNWIGWTVWAVLIAIALDRVHFRQPSSTTTLVLGVVLVIVSLAAVPLISSPWHWLVTGSPSVMHSTAHITGHNLPTNLLLSIAMAVVVQGKSTVDRTRRLEQTAADLRAQLAESQLEVLRARLDPHFLFNALNSAMVLARRGEGRQVEQLLEHLSALLRHSLDSAGAQIVPLRIELEALRHYLDIEQVRHGDRLVVRWQMANGVGDHLVPSLVLQPLVENAIRHGFTDPARVLTVDVSAAQDDGRLVLTVQDDGEGLTRTASATTREGIGLGHTRARLAGLYGNRGSLTLEAVESGRGARVTIVIPATRTTT